MIMIFSYFLFRSLLLKNADFLLRFGSKFYRLKATRNQEAEMGGVSPKPVTELLRRWRHEDSTALEKLLPLVYNELRRIAEQQLRRERPNHTLQPTALVNEVYLKLVEQHSIEWHNRAQFFGVAAQLIRRILVDHVRNQRTAKRGAGTLTLTLDEAVSEPAGQDIDLMKLDDALLSLSRKDEQQSRVVEKRFFGGLSIEETEEALGVSPSTVKRDWAAAKAWLYRDMSNRISS
jgi:RNA polymerase sigma factor (TIGR02999 family)